MSADWSDSYERNRDWLSRRYGAKAGPELARWLTTEMQGRMHADNVRACETSRADEVKAYEQARRDGCCGSVDHALWIDGRAYKIGFNYGH